MVAVHFKTMAACTWACFVQAFHRKCKSCWSWLGIVIALDKEDLVWKHFCGSSIHFEALNCKSRGQGILLAK